MSIYMNGFGIFDNFSGNLYRPKEFSTNMVEFSGIFISSEKNFPSMPSKNPYISFSVPLEEKEKATNICTEKSIKIAEFARVSFLNALDQVHEKELAEAKKVNYDEGYKRGIAELDAIEQIHAKELEEARKQAYQEAKGEFDDKLNELYNTGYHSGYNKGINEGFNKGIVAGYKQFNEKYIEELKGNREIRKENEELRKNQGLREKLPGKGLVKEDLEKIWESMLP